PSFKKASATLKPKRPVAPAIVTTLNDELLMMNYPGNSRDSNSITIISIHLFVYDRQST
ncbi:17433_t:CDS:2, partial [Dentiscutata erythropus]